MLQFEALSLGSLKKPETLVLGARDCNSGGEGGDILGFSGSKTTTDTNFHPRPQSLSHEGYLAQERWEYTPVVLQDPNEPFQGEASPR